MLTVTMASLEGSDDDVMSYGGLVDRDTIHGRDVQLMHDDDVVAEIEGSRAGEHRAELNGTT